MIECVTIIIEMLYIDFEIGYLVLHIENVHQVQVYSP